ncbi:aspartyl protease family protein [Branchiibius cervicis]|uniref:Aspartyl protease family protein n=1 Tax=Branchiibius cervicis TaxID=908252 RepID=A0ABW2AXT2_9MICO
MNRTSIVRVFGMATIPFEELGHFRRIEADLGAGLRGRFIVDTGIGMSVISPSLAQRWGLAPSGKTYVGQRMSGQSIEVPLADLPGFSIGAEVIAPTEAGVFDLGSDGDVDGILGLDVLGALPLTIDPARKSLVLGDELRDAQDVVVPVRVHRDGPAVDMWVDLILPDGTLVEVEIDTGSAATILNDTMLAACGAAGTEPIRVLEGVDETGHSYVRRFIELRESLHLAADPRAIQQAPTVMFQDIAIPGLIGTDFLDQWVQTYDTRDGTLRLRPIDDSTISTAQHPSLESVPANP